VWDLDLDLELLGVRDRDLDLNVVLSVARVPLSSPSIFLVLAKFSSFFLACRV
jgi:hypothetical protein